MFAYLFLYLFLYLFIYSFTINKHFIEMNPDSDPVLGKATVKVNLLIFSLILFIFIEGKKLFKKLNKRDEKVFGSNSEI